MEKEYTNEEFYDEAYRSVERESMDEEINRLEEKHNEQNNEE